jgi:hypothetical protein
MRHLHNLPTRRLTDKAVFALPAAFTLNLEHFAAKRARTLRLHGSSLAIRCTGVGCRRGRALRCRSRRCATKKKRTFFVTLSCPITNAASCQTRRRSEKPVCVDELGPGARGAIPKIRFFAALSLLLAVMQVMGGSGLAKVGRGTGALAPVSRSIPILPRLQKEQT